MLLRNCTCTQSVRTRHAITFYIPRSAAATRLSFAIIRNPYIRALYISSFVRQTRVPASVWDTYIIRISFRSQTRRYAYIGWKRREFLCASWRAENNAICWRSLGKSREDFEFDCGERTDYKTVDRAVFDVIRFVENDRLTDQIKHD